MAGARDLTVGRQRSVERKVAATSIESKLGARSQVRPGERPASGEQRQIRRPRRIVPGPRVRLRNAPHVVVGVRVAVQTGGAGRPAVANTGEGQRLIAGRVVDAVTAHATDTVAAREAREAEDVPVIVERADERDVAARLIDG